MATQFTNATPHPINIFADAIYNDSIRKYVIKDGATATTTVTPSGILLNAQILSEEIDTIDGIKIFGQTIGGCDEPPEGNIICSQLYVAALRQAYPDVIKAGRVYTISDPVYDGTDNPRPVGCRGLTRVV